MIFVLSAWSLYNLPILIAGVVSLRKRDFRRRSSLMHKDKQPFISIIVPVRNEEKVISRLLNSLVKLNYPSDKTETIIVEDGSTDRTLSVCIEFAESHNFNLKVHHRTSADGKPSALNFGLGEAKGEIIGVFDADSVPAPDCLINVFEYFSEPNVAAVQGRTLSTNSEENMLTKLLSYEDAAWCEAYLQGKDSLNLFVGLRGSCMFIRRETLEKLDGFGETFLAEDMELSARLAVEGYKIKYAPDVKSWQENPSSLKQLFRQRTKWYRGWIEVALKYGRLMAKPTRIRIDAEATLLGPFMLIASIVTYFAAFQTFIMPMPSPGAWRFLMQFSGIMTTLLVCSCAIALMYMSKPRKLRSLFWLPFIYFYWCLQAFVALYAFLLILFRRPKEWSRTKKSGTIANSDLISSEYA